MNAKISVFVICVYNFHDCTFKSIQKFLLSKKSFDLKMQDIVQTSNQRD